jgi:hypothetical protein
MDPAPDFVAGLVAEVEPIAAMPDKTAALLGPLEPFAALPDRLAAGAAGWPTKSGCPSQWYKPKTAATTTAAPIPACQGSDGSGPRRGIVRSQGSNKTSIASVQRTPARNQKSVKFKNSL